MSKANTLWSEEDIAQLKELAGVFTAPQIAEKIGRGRDGVLKKIRKLGLPSYNQSGIKPSSPAAHKPVGKAPALTTRKGVSRSTEKPIAVRKAAVNHISFPPLEWCPTCHSPVSNWIDHSSRMGCKRPA